MQEDTNFFPFFMPSITLYTITEYFDLANTVTAPKEVKDILTLVNS